MQKLKPFAMPALLFLASFFLRLSLISKGPYHQDCLYMAIVAQENAQTLAFLPLHTPGYPLVALISTILVGLGKFFHLENPVMIVNFMSVVFGSASIPVFYFLAKKLLNARAATFSTLLYSLSPVFLGASVYGNSNTISLFFLLCGTLLLVSHLESLRIKQLIFSGFFIGLSGAARIDSILFMPALMFLLLTGLYDKKNKSPIAKKLMFLILFLLSAGITALSFYLPLWTHPRFHCTLHDLHRLQNQYAGTLTLGLLEITTGYLMRNFTLWGLAVIALGLGTLLKKQMTLWFFLLWFLVPFLFFSRINCVVPRYFLIAIVPLYMAQGSFFSACATKKPVYKTIAISLLILLAGLQLHILYPTLQVRHQAELEPDFFRWVKEQTEPHAIIIPADEGDFVKYYSQRKVLVRPYGKLEPKKLSAFKKKLDRLLIKKTPVYLTGAGLYSYDYGNRFSRFMETYYDLEFLDQHLAEDWHQGILNPTIGIDYLYRIRPKVP